MDTVAIADRIRYLIKQQRMTQAQFGKRLGIDPANLSKHLSGKLPITSGLINRIVADMGVSKRWLVDGTDVPFAKSSHSGVVGNLSQNGTAVIPVFDIDVTAGSVELSRLFTEDRIIGSVSMPRMSADCAIVRVSGDSMLPVINNGAYIAIRKINDIRNIFWGQIYVIVLEDYRMVKFVRRSTDPEKIILHSANAEYDDMEIDRSDVLGLYLVEAVLNFDLRC